MALLGVRKILPFALTLLLATASVAQADPLSVTAKLNSVSPSVLIDFTLQDKNGLPTPLPKSTTHAGSFNWTTVSTNANITPQFKTFCIELNQYISVGGTYKYAVVDLENGSNPGVGIGGPGTIGPIRQARADQIRQLWGMHYDEVTNNITAAAFQLAIWEIIYGPYFTPYANEKSGTQVKNNGNAAIALANQWWQDVQTRDEHLFENRIVALTNPNAQDEITLATPVPGSLVLAGMGVVSVAGWYRRRKE